MGIQIAGATVVDDDGVGIFYSADVASTVGIYFESSPLNGTVSGYTSGGESPQPPPGGTLYNIIDKFPFASSSNATDAGDLSVARWSISGQSSQTHGYTSGGATSPPLSSNNTVDKFPFGSFSTASDVGDLTQARSRTSGQSSLVSGYVSGGFIPPIQETIDKFPFTSDANSTDVGNLSQLRQDTTGHSSLTDGYTAGGQSPGGVSSRIDKFPFASDNNATQIGTLSDNVYDTSAGQSSYTHGYITGGINTGRNDITKFNFATGADSGVIGILTVLKTYSTGQSSTTHGYSSGGESESVMTNVVEHFPFASDSNAVDVGDLTVSRQKLTGQQD
jgi:hypothetical protein